MTCRMHDKTKRGFTLIELSLAMVFLATLLLAIALITTQIIVIYQKGLAIKAVSSTGRELVDDISRAIAASPAKSNVALCSKITNNDAQIECEYEENPVDANGNRITKSNGEAIKGDGAFKYVYQQETGTVKVNGADETVPTHGVFCTGRYSYLWNTGYTLNETLYPGGEQKQAKLIYKMKNADNVLEEITVENYRFLKLRDQERSVCAAHVDTGNYTIKASNEYRIGETVYQPEELLTLSEDNLAIYDFKVFPPTQHFLSFHSFYSGTFILATVPGGVDITGTGDYCKDEPDGLNTDFAYCAINKFNFAMRATGETNDEEKQQQRN